jgi:4-coumarate--CoA ligase
MTKVKGLQLGATGVEDTLLDHPEYLVADAYIADVDKKGSDRSLFDRAWVMLTEERQ